MGSKLSPSLDFDAIFVTRSTLYMKKDGTFSLAHNNEHSKGAERRPFLYIIDEAHHVGTEQGQFLEIIEQLKRELAPEDTIIYQSATLEHSDLNIISEVSGPLVAASHLLPHEREDVAKGENILWYAKLAYLRGVIYGYINPPVNPVIDMTYNGDSLLDHYSKFHKLPHVIYRKINEMIVRSA